MTEEEFIDILDREGYSYEIVGDKIIVTHRGGVGLNSLTTLPPGVEFKNEASISLSSLKTIPPGVVFNNRGNVHLSSLETLPPGVEFKNEGDVWLDSLETIPPGVEFNNRGDVKLEALIGVWFEEWDGNIDGIDFKRLLKYMISKGVFI